MGRPLTGTCKKDTNGWRAELPTVRGSAPRTGHTFRDEYAAKAWLAAGIKALQRGAALPIPDTDDLTDGGRTRGPAGVRTAGTGQVLAHAGTAGSAATSDGGSGSRPGTHAAAGGHAAPVSTSFRDMAEAWVQEYYGDLRRARAGREQAVRGHVDIIDTWMTGRGLDLERLTRPRRVEFSKFLSDRPADATVGGSVSAVLAACDAALAP